MMTDRLPSVLLALAILLFGATVRALALGTETFGNEPIPVGFNLGQDVLALANLKTRFYWYEVNGNPTFFYHGKAASLNEALRKFAALAGDAREVILLPGPGKGHSLTGEKQFAYDRWVNTPAGLHRGGPPTMTVYINAVAPVIAPDAKQLQRWIADFDSDSFTTRDKASQELEKLGHAAAPALNKALAANPSAEARQRIQRLLDELQGIDVRDVQVPAGVTVLEVKDLLKRYRAEFNHADPITRGHATSGLGGLAQYADVLPDLVGVLKNDKHEYARRSAIGALARLGKKATVALPLLTAGLNDPDVNVRTVCDYAIKTIVGAKEEGSNAEQIKRQHALLEGISVFRKALPGELKK